MTGLGTIPRYAAAGGLSLLLLLLPIRISAGVKYPVSAISPSLLGGSGPVVRYSSVRFECKDKRMARMNVILAMTVFRNDQREQTDEVIAYNRFCRVEDLNGTIYDAEGNEVRSLAGEDVQDYSAVDDNSLFEDTRIKTVSLFYDRYPYTIEYSYTITYDGYLNWPTWYARKSGDAVEFSEFDLIGHPADSLRYRSNSDSVVPRIETTKEQVVYHWEVRNLPPLSPAQLSEDPDKCGVVVRTAPRRFRVEDYAGDLSSWKSFGSWMMQLYNQRQHLPPSCADDVRRICQDDPNERSRVEKLYRYMQSRTRYISVQLGIGGWQPFEALYVHERGYGDCKALANYMVAILQEGGIPAYPALISHGSDNNTFDAEFPSNQFNHVIVCVPMNADTMWLECTNATVPAGHIGADNENRYALLITPGGGVLTRTPASASRTNSSILSGSISLAASGAAVGTVVSSWGGDQADRMREALVEVSPAHRNQLIADELKFGDLSLAGYEVGGQDTAGESVHLLIKFQIPHFGSGASNRLFLRPARQSGYTVPPENNARKSPIRFRYPFRDLDTLNINLPPGYRPEALPEEATARTSFGSFHSVTSLVSDTTIRCIREMEIRTADIPPERFSEYRAFLTTVVKADNARIVLARKE